MNSILLLGMLGLSPGYKPTKPFRNSGRSWGIKLKLTHHFLCGGKKGCSSRAEKEQQGIYQAWAYMPDMSLALTL